ncbi:MAG: hypothetical protein F4Z08_07880 [Chloroflexi bacterium]|nr:hypothetical protein [Chloroflexota bacterium]
MIEGRFGDTSGRPYVEGRVYFARFDLEGDISFLVDTGADASLLNPEMWPVSAWTSTSWRDAQSRSVWAEPSSVSSGW